MLVHQDRRRQGIGAQLIAKAKEWTGKKRLFRLLVTSQTYRDDAHRFYKREGFERWKESTFFVILLGGAAIRDIRAIPYAFDHTYDILPDSDTGTYFAGGVAIGSTLSE